jgi:hypothetical protein
MKWIGTSACGTTFALATLLAVMATSCALLDRALDSWNQRERQQSFGRLSAAQVLEEARSIGRAVLPDTGEMTYTAASSRCHATGRRSWDVTVQDGRGEGALYMMWDADTGELISLTRPIFRPDDRRPWSEKEAVRAARGWMSVLRIDRGRPWRLDHTEHVRGRGWLCSFRAPGRSACVQVESGTGELVFAISVASLR